MSSHQTCLNLIRVVLHQFPISGEKKQGERDLKAEFYALISMRAQIIIKRLCPLKWECQCEMRVDTTVRSQTTNNKQPIPSFRLSFTVTSSDVGNSLTITFFFLRSHYSLTLFFFDAINISNQSINVLKTRSILYTQFDIL